MENRYHIQEEDETQGGGFGEPRTRLYVAEIATGLWLRRVRKSNDRDLKLDNVMLDHAGHIKLVDFGLCKENLAYGVRTTTIVGTEGYLAPEIVKLMGGGCNSYGFEVDWWSLGVLTHEMLFEDSPFDGDEQDELFQDILTKEPIVEEYDHVKVSDDSYSFVKQLLQRDPPQRLGYGEEGKGKFQAHPFFKTLDWARVESRAYPPVFVPKAGDTAANFDQEFTGQKATISPADPRDEIEGFSFVAEGFGTASDGGHSAAKPYWLKEEYGRGQAEQYVRGEAVGTFIVRKSSSVKGGYALVVGCGGNTKWSGLIIRCVPTLTCHPFLARATATRRVAG